MTNSNGNGSKRAIMTALAVLLAMVAALMVVQLVVAARTVPRGPAVTYGFTPGDVVEDELCPGEALRYPLRTTVQEVPAVVDVVWNWCVSPTAGRSSTEALNAAALPPGYCSGQHTQQQVYGILQPLHSTIPMAVIVPDLPPGKWELRHLSVIRNDGTGNAYGYSVPFRVKANEECN